MKNSFFMWVACGFLAITTGAHAATVYDESVDGDAFGFILPGTDLGTLTSGTTSTIIGSYAAGSTGDLFDGSDEQDSYTFTTLSSFTVNATTRTGDDAYYALMTVPGPVLLDGSAPATDMFGTVGAGTYSLTVIGVANGGAGSYSLDINVAIAAVPLPASVPLLLSGLGALGLLRRRRNRGV